MGQGKSLSDPEDGYAEKVVAIITAKQTRVIAFVIFPS